MQGDVGPARPLVRLAQLLHAREERGAGGLQARQQRGAVAAGERAGLVDGGAHLAQPALRLLARQGLLAGQRLHALAERGDARVVLFELARGLRPHLRLPLAQVRLGVLEAILQVGVLAQHARGGPALAQGVGLAPRLLEVGAFGRGLHLLGQLGQAGAPLLRGRMVLLPALDLAHRARELLAQALGLGIVAGSQGVPGRARFGQPFRRLVPVEGLDRREQRPPVLPRARPGGLAGLALVALRLEARALRGILGRLHGRSGDGRRLQRIEQRARLASRRLVAGAGGHRFQRRTVREARGRADGHVLQVALLGQLRQHGVVVDGLQRALARGGVLRGARHRRQGARVLQAAERPAPHAEQPRAAGHLDEVARLLQGAQRGLGGRRLLAAQGHAQQGLGRFLPHALVRVGGGHLSEDTQIVQPAHGGAPHAGVLVLAGHRHQDLALIGSELAHRRQSGVSVLVLPGRAATESVQQRHQALQKRRAYPIPGPQMPPPVRLLFP